MFGIFPDCNFSELNKNLIKVIYCGSSLVDIRA